MLLCDARGDIEVGDWKRIRDLLYENRYNRLVYPLCHLDDCNWWLYALQLNMYVYFLGSEYHMRVSDMLLYLVHPTRATPEIVRVPRLDMGIRAIVEYEIEQGRAS